MVCRFQSHSAKNGPLLKFKPTWSLSGEVVTTVSGKPVEIQVFAKNTLRDVLKNIAAQIDICHCKLRFVSELGEVEPGLNVRTWLEDMQAGKLRLYRICISRMDKDLKSYYADDCVCLRCLREAGFQAKDFIDEKIRLTAVQFRWAGYTLKDLLHCFPEDLHPLRMRPVVRSFTLFDCQLKDAGYDAKDFKDAGYYASELSAPVNYYFEYCQKKDAGYEAKDFKDAGYSASEPSQDLGYYCEDPEGLIPGIFRWVELGAIFTASELAFAGYSASELLAARFPESEILSAGCSSEELV